MNSLRNELGGTNIKFTVTSVEGMGHTDTWSADNGTGACAAVWTTETPDNSWKIKKDAISFTPKAAEKPKLLPRKKRGTRNVMLLGAKGACEPRTLHTQRPLLMYM